MTGSWLDRRHGGEGATYAVGLLLCVSACGPSFMPRADGTGSGVSVVGEDGGAASAADRRRDYADPGGMWTPAQLAQHAEELTALGLELDPKVLTDPTAYPLGAVVYLGGCTGSFVSPDGLVITNHHCVTRALQYNSTPEDNLLEHGTLAAKRGEEKWIGPTGRVFVTRSQRDITVQMRTGIAAISDPKERHDTLESRSKKLVAECEKGRPQLRCSVSSFFGGGQYLLVERLELRDIRLVYAPAAGIGNYGGEIDNWRWPRHSGDYAFYRAYVGPDGQPADHAASNIPYKPKHHLRLATKPLGEHDLVFLPGYPARTTRLRTAQEVQYAVDWRYPRSLRLCNEYIALLERLGRADEQLAIKGQSLRRGLSNYRTNIRGTLDGLVAGGLAQKKVKLEQQLQQWIDETPERRAEYGSAIARLAKAHTAFRAHRDQDAALREVLWMSGLLGSAMTIVRMADERPKADAERDPEFQQRNWKRLAQAQQAAQRSYDRSLDRAKLTLALRRAAMLDPSMRPAVLRLVVGKAEPTTQAIEAALASMYEKTSLEDVDHRVKLLDTASLDELRQSSDPFVALAVALLPIIREMEDRDDIYAGAAAIHRPRYVAALREQQGGKLAPDANRTLRVSYGTVRGYRAAPDKPPYYPFSRLSGVVKKHTGTAPFVAPRRLLAAGAAGSFEPYVHERLGEVPVDFLTDLDITGGNSGSPTLDARGELVGLAFDGNYEAMASDWLFMPEITRAIHVDLRYVLWVMTHVDRADHLLREMGVVPAPE